MSSKGNGPILNTTIVWANTWNPFRLVANAIDFWAWAPLKHLGLSCSGPTRVGWVTVQPNRRTPCGRVPVKPRRSPLLKWALTPNLGLCRLGLGHITRYHTRTVVSIVVLGDWAWIMKVLGQVLVYEAHVGLGWISRCNCVHFNRFFLRHVISDGCGDCVWWGLMWPNMVWLWWHPTFQPVPIQLGSFTLIATAFNIINTWLYLQILLLQKQKSLTMKMKNTYYGPVYFYFHF